MSKGKLFLCFGAPVLVGSLICCLPLRSREPAYKGRALSEWIEEYYADSRADVNDDTPHTEAYYAIRTIGTNALPTLLGWVAHAPAKPDPRLAAFANLLLKVNINNRLVWKVAYPECRPNNWWQTFGVLGEEANGAVPELTRLMHASDASDEEGLAAAYALAYLGPAGLPSLEAAVLNPKARCRFSAIKALDDVGCVGANSVALVPVLNRMLTNADVVVRTAATNAFISRALVVEQHGSL